MMEEKMFEPKNVAEAILAVMHHVGYVQKQKSGGLKFAFAGEGALIQAIRPWMLTYGLILTVEDVDYIREESKSSSGTSMTTTVAKLTGRFTHAPSGTSLVVSAIGEGRDSSDKASPKAMTGAYKYLLRETFLIETGDDPDADQGGTLKARVWTSAQKKAVLDAKVPGVDGTAKVLQLLNLTTMSEKTPASTIADWCEVFKEARKSAPDAQSAAMVANDDYITKQKGE